MTQKIYVGNLPYSASEEQLRELFEKHGPVVSVNLVSDHDTGRSKGFAFVEMSPNDAIKAINELNGYEMQGRPLRVNEARPKERSGGGGRGGRGDGERRGGGGGFRRGPQRY